MAHFCQLFSQSSDLIGHFFKARRDRFREFLVRDEPKVPRCCIESLFYALVELVLIPHSLAFCIQGSDLVLQFLVKLRCRWLQWICLLDLLPLILRYRCFYRFVIHHDSSIRPDSDKISAIRFILFSGDIAQPWIAVPASSILLNLSSWASVA